MNEDYLKSWTMMSNEMQKPFREMFELHVSTLKSLRFLKPEELSSLRQPTDLLSKNLALAMENSHNILNYMQKSFLIFEEAFSSLSKEMRENAGQSFEQIKTQMEDESKRPSTRRKETAKKAAASAKPAAKTAKVSNQKLKTKAAAIMDTKAQSKTVASKTKSKNSTQKLSLAPAKKVQTAKNQTAIKRNLTEQEKKKTSTEKKPSTIAKKAAPKATAKKTAEPKKALSGKKINIPQPKPHIPEKRATPEEGMPVPKPSASMIEQPPMNFANHKIPESKLNMPHRQTSSTESKILESESGANRFKDKNPFGKQ